MTEEERKLMIAIAKSLEKQGKAILNLQQKPPENITGGGEMVPILTGPQKLQTIEHLDHAKRFKMEVQFKDAATWTYDVRMKNAEQFLSELEELFRDYDVIKLNGSYERYPGIF